MVENIGRKCEKNTVTQTDKSTPNNDRKDKQKESMNVEVEVDQIELSFGHVQTPARPIKTWIKVQTKPK